MTLSNAPGSGIERAVAPAAAEAGLLRPEIIARHGAMTGVEAAKAGIGGVMNVMGAALPLVGVGFLTWWGMDMILGGALSHPFTPQSAKRMA